MDSTHYNVHWGEVCITYQYFSFDLETRMLKAKVKDKGCSW